MQAILAAFFQPLADAFFSAIGRTFREWLADLRAEKAQRDLGAAQAQIEGRKQQDASLDRTRKAMDEADGKPIDYRD